jgi:hypothetical protein
MDWQYYASDSQSNTRFYNLHRSILGKGDNDTENSEPYIARLKQELLENLEHVCDFRNHGDVPQEIMNAAIKDWQDNPEKEWDFGTAAETMLRVKKGMQMLRDMGVLGNFEK